MKKVSRAQEQFSELNFRNASEKTAYDWNMAYELAKGVTHVVNEVRRGVDVAGHDTAGVGRGITHGLGMAGHGIADVAKGVGHGVANLFDKGRHDVAGVGHSVANEFDTARHDLSGAVDALGRGESAGAHSFASEFDRARHDVAGATDAVGGGIGDAAKAVGHGVAEAFDPARHEVAGVGHSVANEFDRARHDVAGAGDAVGGAIGDAAKAVGHGFTGAGDAAGGGAVGDTGRAIGHGVAEVFDPARHDVAGVGHSIANEFNRVRHDVAGAGDAVGNAIGDAGKAVVNKLDPIADKENQLSKNPLNALYPLGLGLGLAGGTMLHHQRQVNKIKKDMELKKQQAESEGIDKKSSFDERYASEKTAIVAPVNLGDAIQQGTSVAQDIIGGLGLALPTLGVGKAVKTVVDKVKRNKAIDDRDLAERKEMWRLYGPIHWGDMIEQHGPAADPSHPDHDLNNQYIRQFSRTSLPSFKPRTRRASAKTAGAWPSNTDWETHLKSLETLLGEVQKGVGWHAAMEQDKEMKAHDKAGKAIQEAIDATRRIMQFPDAGKDK